MGAVSSIIPYLGTEEVSGKENIVAAMKACAAELVGTLFLVLVGCGSCMGASADFVRIGNLVNPDQNPNS